MADNNQSDKQKKEQEEAQRKMDAFKGVIDAVKESAEVRTEDTPDGYSQGFLSLDLNDYISMMNNPNSFIDKIKSNPNMGDSKDIVKFYLDLRAVAKSFERTEENQEEIKQSNNLIDRLQKSNSFYSVAKELENSDNNISKELSDSFEASILSDLRAARRDTTKELKSKNKLRHFSEKRGLALNLLDRGLSKVKGGERNMPSSPVQEMYSSIISNINIEDNKIEPKSIKDRVFFDSVKKDIRENPYDVAIDTAIMEEQLKEDLEKRREFLLKEKNVDSESYREIEHDIKIKERLSKAIKSQGETARDNAIDGYLKSDGFKEKMTSSKIFKRYAEQKAGVHAEKRVRKNSSPDVTDKEIKEAVKQEKERLMSSSKYLSGMLDSFSKSKEGQEYIEGEKLSERERIDKEIKRRKKYLDKIAKEAVLKNQEGYEISVGSPNSSYAWTDKNNKNYNIQLHKMDQINDKRVFGIEYGRDYCHKGEVIARRRMGQYTIPDSVSDPEAKMEAFKLSCAGVLNDPGQKGKLYINISKKTSPEEASEMLRSAVEIMYRKKVIDKLGGFDNVTESVDKEIQQEMAKEMKVSGKLPKGFELEDFISRARPDHIKNEDKVGKHPDFFRAQEVVEDYLKRKDGYDGFGKDEGQAQEVGISKQELSKFLFSSGKNATKTEIKGKLKAISEACEGNDMLQDLKNAADQMIEKVSEDKYKINKESIVTEMSVIAYEGEDKLKGINKEMREERTKEVAKKLGVQSDSGKGLIAKTVKEASGSLTTANNLKKAAKKKQEEAKKKIAEAQERAANLKEKSSRGMKKPSPSSM